MRRRKSLPQEERRRTVLQRFVLPLSRKTRKRKKRQRNQSRVHQVARRQPLQQPRPLPLQLRLPLQQPRQLPLQLELPLQQPRQLPLQPKPRLRLCCLPLRRRRHRVARSYVATAIT